jgi:His-Xaa-Ser system radical SAM maturase HxsC
VGDAATNGGGVIRLGVRGCEATGLVAPVLGRITRAPVASEERPDHVLVIATRDEQDARGYAGVIVEPGAGGQIAPAGVPAVYGVTTDHLCDGDVVSLQPPSYVRTLYRRASLHNSIFATDRCNSLCLMCSQPPKDVSEDGIVAQHLRLIDLIDPATLELGISGGEPTLLGDGLVQIIAACKDRLPSTALHVLSNGRLFQDAAFARAVADIEHPDLMFGIPVYSDLDAQHDYVVQAKGAFDQTIRGLQNLGRHGVPVEIRVVIHRQTYARLPDLAEFIYRNLTFASHVALMGLEMTGFTIPNLPTLWIDPVDYQPQLARATLFLAARGVRVSIYNHQLCTVPPVLWQFCRQSISDWKNEYLPECESCAERTRCGGFFTSSVQRRYSDHIHSLAPAV